MKPSVFLRYLLLPAAVVAGSLLGGWWNFTVPFVCFILHPISGLVTGNQTSHDEHDKTLTYPHNHYRLVALLFVPVLLFTTGWAICQVSRETFSLIAFTGLVLSTGIMNGIIGFTLAHEFIHRRERTDRLAGHLLLLQNNYLHYSIEHIGGHHVYACTDRDPHTARVNESFYLFFPRAVAGTFTNAWEIECKRLIKRKKSLVGWHNRMFVFMGIQLLAALTVTLLAGEIGLLFLLLQGFVAVFLLHITNYLQHYGLVRKETAPGRTEKTEAHHAWCARKGNDGLNLFQLENHADHHMHPSRSYEQLVAHPASPEMPTGYSGMILLALFPSFWFRIMNKRIPSFITQNNQI